MAFFNPVNIGIGLGINELTGPGSTGSPEPAGFNPAGPFPSTGAGMTVFERYEENYNFAQDKGTPWGGMETNWQHFWRPEDPNAVGQMAYDSMREILGRDVTQTEFTKWLPYFPATPSGPAEGRSIIAQVREREDKEATEEEESGKPEDFTDDVSGMFQDILGRDPSADELEHYSTLMAEEGIDSFELGRFLKQDPEFLKQQDVEFREGVSEETLGFQDKAIGRLLPAIVSQYQRSGTKHSTALDFAMTDMAEKLEENRQNFLLNLSFQQYGGNKATARADYNNLLNQQINDQTYQRGLEARDVGRQDYLQDVYRNRAFSQADYAQQLNAFNQSQQGGEQTPWWQPVAAGAVGIGAGVASKNPYVGLAAYQGANSLFNTF